MSEAEHFILMRRAAGISQTDSGRPLRVKRGLLSLQISDQLFGAINRELIADRKARVLRAFLIQRRKFSETRNA
jgi:hypothetical protein